MPPIPSSSSPSSVHPLYNGNTQPLPQSSLSESVLSNTNSNPQRYVSQISSRPSRFVKPTTTASMNNNINNNLSLDMKTYLQQVDDYSQKIYMEGYLMQHKKKYYAELCGSTFTLWDTTRPGNTITPEYIPIVLDIHVYPTTANDNPGHQFILELPHKNKVLKLNTLDHVSLKKWIAAFRLVCFERQLLHQFYTFHLFLQPNTISSASTTTSGYLQVLLPNTKNNNEWKKLWVSIIPSSSYNSSSTTTTALKKSKLLGNNNNNNNNNKQDTSSTLSQLVLYETKKSKQPLLALNYIHHAYAVYPEIPSLIHQSTLIRLEGVQNGEMMELLFMADSNQHMIQWLSNLFNAFSLYGLPGSLLQDPMNPSSLNFGDTIPSTFSSDDDHDDSSINNKHRINSQWWLETDDILQHMDIYSQSTNKHDMYQLFVNALSHKQQQQQSSSSLQQHRAKSLPLITVESIDPSRQQRAASDAGLLNESSTLRSQVADSSDESDDDFEEEEEDEEPDSDDEPIGRSKPLVNKKAGADGSSKETSASSLLIPDFDFGNGFDTTKYESSSLKNEITSTTFSGHSSSTSSPSPSTNRRKSSARPQQRQFSSGSSIISNNSSGSHSHGDRKKSTTASSPSPSSSSILFGDFSLTADFNKYLDPTLLPKSRTPTPDRKYSLPMKTYSISNSPATSNSSGLDRRRLSWDNQRGDEDGRSHSSGSGSGLLGSGGQHGWDERSPRSRYLDEDYIYGGDDEQDDEDDEEEDQDRYDDDYDQEGPLIPSLSDHFAPQNSLLDNLLGEQLSAKEQIEYARATGQPLIQVPTKPRPPKGGLVGVISERERHRKQGHNPRVAERVQQHHIDRLEREKERRILEQRQQQFMKHQMMMYAANGYVHPMMMHPYMNPPSPGNNMMPMPPLMSPGSPHTSTSSPITPTSPMPSSPNGLLYGRPYSPSGYYAHPHPHPHYQQQQQPHYFTNGLPMTPNSTQYSARRYSKPLLSEDEDEEQAQEENEDDDEDEPLYTTTTASMINAYHNHHQYARTASPTTMYHHHRKMNPVPSTSTGNTSIRL